jgi:hypothetical protein
LESDVAQKTGCKLDTERVWTSTSCSDGFLTRGGSSSANMAVECSSADQKFPVRCCATGSNVVKGARG